MSSALMLGFLSSLILHPSTVKLTAPRDGTMFKPGANITISAIASDSAGKVTKVEFYDGDTKLGEDTSAPYVYKWKNVPAGSHTLTARATDDKDAVGISDARNVHLLVMRDPEDPADTVQGVAYKYYVGSWAKDHL